MNALRVGGRRRIDNLIVWFDRLRKTVRRRAKKKASWKALYCALWLLSWGIWIAGMVLAFLAILSVLLSAFVPEGVDIGIVKLVLQLIVGALAAILAFYAPKVLSDKTKRRLTWLLGLAVWVGAVLYLVQLFFAWLFVSLIPAWILAQNGVQSVYQVVVYAISLFVIIAVPWALFNCKTSRDELGLKGLPTWTDLLLAPVFFIATILVAMLLRGISIALMPGVDWEQAQNVGYNGMMGADFWTFAGAFVCLVVLAPICEEIIFRGWLYAKLRARLAAPAAIIIVSVLFGVMHGQWNVGITVFAMSIGMCVMRELTGTIWGGILLHMIKNGIAFYLLYVLGAG